MTTLSRSKKPTKITKTAKPTKKKKLASKSGVRQRCLASFQKLRRLEEADENGMVRCISCGRVMHWSEAQGGHYIGRANRVTELEKDNVFPQCPTCNGMLSGNPVRYRINLVRKIGEPRVKRLEDMLEASKGSEEAYGRLSNEDKAKVTEKKGLRYYLDKKSEFDDQIFKIKDRRRDNTEDIEDEEDDEE